MPDKTSNTLLALCLVLCLPATLIAKPAGGPPGGPPSATVQVNCTHFNPASHDSITAALNNPAQELTIEINGICIEDIVIRRDFVTLRGKNHNANVDGIHSATPGKILGGPVGQEIRESVVSVRGGVAIRFENLFIGEGQENRSGMGVSENSIVTISNCRVENNPDFGVGAFSGSVLFIVDSTVTGNSTFGGISAGGGLLQVTDGSLFDGLVILDNGLFTMSGGSLDGTILSLTNSSVELGGFALPAVSHTGTFNLIGGDSSIRVGSGSTLQGLTLVSEFSNFVLRDGSTLNGSLICSLGGDASCDVSSNVTGSSNCGQCP